MNSRLIASQITIESGTFALHWFGISGQVTFSGCRIVLVQKDRRKSLYDGLETHVGVWGDEGASQQSQCKVGLDVQALVSDIHILLSRCDLGD